MKYKYRVQHRVSTRMYFKFVFKYLVNNITYPFINPIQTNFTTCFIGGCGHSGTTLTAAKIGNHPAVYLIPRETHNFEPSNGLHCSKLVTLEWLNTTEFLDKSVLIEKTPKHIHSIKRIKKILPKSKFILTLRNPLDNCASLLNRFKNIGYATERWLIDNKELLKIKDKNSFFVKYEDITSRPLHEFKKICSFLDIPWNEEILINRKTVYDKIVQNGNMEIRRSQVNNIIEQNFGKWANILSKNQEKFVIEKTQSLANKLGYSTEYLQMLTH